MSHKDHIGVGYYGFSNNSDCCPWCEIERLRNVLCDVLDSMVDSCGVVNPRHGCAHLYDEIAELVIQGEEKEI